MQEQLDRIENLLNSTIKGKSVYLLILRNLYDEDDRYIGVFSSAKKVYKYALRYIESWQNVKLEEIEKMEVGDKLVSEDDGNNYIVIHKIPLK